MVDFLTHNLTSVIFSLGSTSVLPLFAIIIYLKKVEAIKNTTDIATINIVAPIKKSFASCDKFFIMY